MNYDTKNVQPHTILKQREVKKGREKWKEKWNNALLYKRNIISESF